MSQTPAMTYAERVGNYSRQNKQWGLPTLTPAQSRRARKKANSGRAQ